MRYIFLTSMVMNRAPGVEIVEYNNIFFLTPPSGCLYSKGNQADRLQRWVVSDLVLFSVVGSQRQCGCTWRVFPLAYRPVGWIWWYQFLWCLECLLSTVPIRSQNFLSRCRHIVSSWWAVGIRAICLFLVDDSSDKEKFLVGFGSGSHLHHIICCAIPSCILWWRVSYFYWRWYHVDYQVWYLMGMGAQIVFMAWHRLRCICAAFVIIGLCDDCNIQWRHQLLWDWNRWYGCGYSRRCWQRFDGHVFSLITAFGKRFWLLLLRWGNITAYLCSECLDCLQLIVGLLILLLRAFFKSLVDFMIRYVGVTVGVAMLWCLNLNMSVMSSAPVSFVTQRMQRIVFQA